MGVTKDATAQLVKMEQDGPVALQQVPCSRLSCREHLRAHSCTWTSGVGLQRMKCARACRGEARGWAQARGSG